MTDNPFHDAIQVPPRETVEREPERPFFAAQIDAQRLRADVGAATRQAMFNAGVLGVEDLDDEELRYGRCRDLAGHIPKVTNKTEMLPRDLYDAMVAEHERRTDEKLRQNLDDMLEVMVGVAKDDTVEPRDRFEAAKYLFERVKGKTPERVQVAVTQQPWEEVFAGVAKITRAQSMALQQGVIEGEVVGVDSEVVHPNPMAEGGGDPLRPPTGPGPGGAGIRGEHMVAAGIRWHPEEAGPVTDGDEYAEARVGPFQPPTRAPNFDTPANSNPVVELSNSERLRKAHEQAAALAERRKAAKQRIQAAKKARIIKRAMGVDGATSGEGIADTQGKLTDALDAQPEI